MASWSPRREGGRTLIEYQPDDLVWALYARESDADDLEQVSAQLADLRPFALGIGGRIGREFLENNTSAYKRRRVRLPDGTFGFRVVRPDWDAMMTGLRKGIYNAVGCVNIDRGMRDPRDLEDLIDLVEQYGVLVKGMTGSIDLTSDDGISSARTQVNQRNSESRNTSRRISTGNRRAAFKGTVKGGGHRAFGWRKDKKRLHKRESALIRQTAPRLIAGVKPMTVAREWTELGIATVRGGAWTATTLRQIFTNPRLCGWRVYRGAVLRDSDDRPVPGQWELILTEREHEDLVRVLSPTPSGEAPVRGKGRGSATKFLLSGVVRCGKCHAKMSGNYQKTRTGDRYPVYRCRAKGEGGCGGCFRNAEQVDRHIIALVIAEQKKRQFRRLDTKPRQWDGQQRLAAVTRKIADTTAEYKTSETMSAARYFALIEDLEAEERQMKADRRRHDAKHAQQRAAVVNLEAEWDRPDFTLELKQAAIAASISAVIIHPALRRSVFDPDRIEVVWRDDDTDTAA